MVIVIKMSSSVIQYLLYVEGVWFTCKQLEVRWSCQTHVGGRRSSVPLEGQCYQHCEGRSRDGTQVYGLWAGWYKHQLLCFLHFLYLLSVFAVVILFVGNVIRDVPDIRFRLAGYPAIFSNPVPVPAKTVPGTGYLSRIVLGPKAVSWT